jgi:predicted regulator of Ras-like GTPase activity (Roadblock/LC7/MglB family)
MRTGGVLHRLRADSCQRVSLGPVDAAQALADLTEISSQIAAAVLFDKSGSVQGSTLGSEEAARAFARAAAELLAGAGAFRSGEGAVTQLEASTAEGSVFVVLDGDRRIAATTGPAPTVGLVFYDLKSCLRNADSEPEAPKPARRKKAADEA